MVQFVWIKREVPIKMSGLKTFSKNVPKFWYFWVIFGCADTAKMSSAFLENCTYTATTIQSLGVSAEISLHFVSLFPRLSGRHSSCNSSWPLRICFLSCDSGALKKVNLLARLRFHKYSGTRSNGFRR